LIRRKNSVQVTGDEENFLFRAKAAKLASKPDKSRYPDKFRTSKFKNSVDRLTFVQHGQNGFLLFGVFAMTIRAQRGSLDGSLFRPSVEQDTNCFDVPTKNRREQSRKTSFIALVNVRSGSDE
jgi:hypothetical protein